MLIESHTFRIFQGIPVSLLSSYFLYHKICNRFEEGLLLYDMADLVLIGMVVEAVSSCEPLVKIIVVAMVSLKIRW